VEDGPNKCYIGGLPPSAATEEIQKFLGELGPLSAFSLVKDRDTGVSKGFAFFSFKDPSITQRAVAVLNGRQFQGAVLNCKVARTTSSSSGLGPTQHAGTGPAARTPSEFLVFFNMVSHEDVEDTANAAGVANDVQSECAKFGKVLQLILPRRSAANSGSAPASSNVHPSRQAMVPTGAASGSDLDVGKIFVRFGSVGEAARAVSGLAGRKFAHRTVLPTFLNADQWKAVAAKHPVRPCV